MTKYSKSLNLIKKLVQIRSLSGEEGRLAKFIASYLSEKGVKTIEIKNAGLVAKIEGLDRSKALIFNTHMDTVSEGDLESWKYPPFGEKSGKVKGGKVYGLGASDMKASITSLLLLAERLKNKKPSCDVLLSFVVKEETDGSGTINFIRWFKDQQDFKKYDEIAAIVCEPTNLIEIDLGHRGNVFIKLTVKGDAGHGSRPDLIKTNATKQISSLVLDLESNKNKVLKNYSHPFMGNATIGTTSVESGKLGSPNRFPDSGSVGLDFRFVSGFDEKPERVIREILPDHEFQYQELNKFDPENAAFVDRDEKVVQALSKASAINKFGIKLSSTDMATFVKNGIPACIFGPGKPELIHKSNEYCEIDKIEKATEIFVKTINIFGSAEIVNGVGRI